MNYECLKDWLSIGLEPFVLLLVALLGYIMGFRTWRRQKVEEGKYLKQQIEYEAKLEAVKALWGLLVYFSETDNDKNMLRRGETRENHKVIYFRPSQAELFFKRLQEVVFIEGHGLFMPKEIKRLIFELRNMMYGLYLNTRKHHVEEEAIENEHLERRIREIRDQLIKELRQLIRIT